MTVKEAPSTAGSQPRGAVLLAMGGLLGALAASSCCMLPLVLFSLGVSGAWIGNFTQFSAFQLWFIVATIVSLALGYRLVYRSSKLACGEGQTCARPVPNRIVKAALVLATVLVIAALGFDFVAPLLFHT